MPNPATAGLPNPSSYDTSAPGVVIDNVTGLMWQHPRSKGSFSQADGIALCRDLQLAGYADWRLPTRIELVSIVDFTRSSPALDPSAFPDDGYDGSHWTGDWTSSAPGFSLGSAWYVGCGLGESFYGVSSEPHRIRCVR
jgi:hypothetical protein